MANTNIDFIKEKNGYDREQVDSYIEKLSDMYQKIYNEYIVISGKYKELLETNSDPGAQERTESNSEIVAKTLLNAEMLAQKITEDAKAEAAVLVAEAQRMKAEANTDTVQAAKEEAARIITNANATVAMAREEAQRIINEANAAANQTKEEARKTIEDANAGAIRAAEEEARKIVNDAHAAAVRAEEAARKIINDTNSVVVKTAEEEAGKIIDDARAEAARAEEAAQKNIDKATSDAIQMIAHARNNLKQARAKMEQTSSEIEELLAFQTPERIKMEQALSEVEKVLALHTQEREKPAPQPINAYRTEKRIAVPKAIISLEELNREFTYEELG